MGKLTVSLPDSMTDWIDEQISQGLYEDASEYLHAVIAKEVGVSSSHSEMSIGQLQAKVAASLHSGRGTRTLHELFVEAEQRARDGQAS